MGLPISAVTGLALMQRKQAGLSAARTVFLGDSITIGSADNTNPDQPVYAANFPSLACAYSQGRLLLVRNKGIGGQNTTQILARFDADVLAYAPAICHILMGTNDLEGTAIETTLANITAAVLKCRRNGITPILGTIPAKTSATALGQINRHKVNARLRQIADAYNLILVDYFKATVDPATGGFLSALSADGVHPNIAGQKVMAQLLADTVQYRLPANAPLVRTTTGSDRITPQDYSNCLNHGCFVTDSNADGVPEFWTGGADANHTLTLEADALLSGKWAQCVKANATLKTWLQQTVVTDSVTDLVINGVLASKCTSASKPFVGADKGMMLIIAPGQADFNAGDYAITDTTSAICQVDSGNRDLGALGATGGIGRWGYGGGFEEGDTVAFMYLLQTENVEAGGMTYTTRLNFTGSGGKFLTINSVWTYDTNIAGGALVYGEGKVPSGTTQIVVENLVNVGTGTIRIANQTLLNLTKLGSV